ncbi:MAG: DnaJ domain-containing protein [Oscillospiraceae bacterium]|nr:DnaJ domain-containing protein [Oscillospiraceae bacterium]
MERWQDYYSVLQVHPDAEIEVIQSAYKRLCKKYHPDVNPSAQAAEKIKHINIAYEVLSDSGKRRAFHLEWTRRLGTRAPAAPPRVEVRERVVYVNRTPPAPPPPPKKDMGTLAANTVIKNYFSKVSEKKFREAFELVSELDKQRFSYGSYVEWQESVAAIYQIGSFDIELFRRHAELKAEESSKYRAEEFTVSVSEKDVRTGRVNEYSFTKYAVCENGIWRVYLGYRDLTPLLVQFKTMASTQEEAVLINQWDEYRDTHDLTIGLLNKKGLEKVILPEVYRQRRYDRPFSIAVFNVILPDRITDDSHRKHVMKYIGYIISKGVRLIDHVSWLGGDCYGLLLAESDKRTSVTAARRILKAVMHDVAACFDFEIEIKMGVTPYQGANTDDMISQCMRTIGASGDRARARA